MVAGGLLGEEVLAGLGDQGAVQRNRDGELAARQRLPLDGGDVGGQAPTNLEHVALRLTVVADGVEAVGVGVELGALATGGQGAEDLEGAHVRLARGEEQGGRVDLGHAAGAGVEGVGALLERSAEVLAALGQAGEATSGLLVVGLAVGADDVGSAVGEGLQEALLLRHGDDGGGVQADLGVVQVGGEAQVGQVRVDGGLVAGELDGDPLVAGQDRHDPALGVVRDGDLVAAVGTVLLDELADELDALAGRGGLAEDDAGVAVLADAGLLVQGVGGLGLGAVARAQRGGAGDALLVDACGGVGVGVIVPLVGGVTDVGVAVRGLVRGPAEVGLVGEVRDVLHARLDAVALEVAVAVVLVTTDVVAAVLGVHGRHPELRALGERGCRDGREHDRRGQGRSHGLEQAAPLHGLSSLIGELRIYEAKVA